MVRSIVFHPRTPHSYRPPTSDSPPTSAGQGGSPSSAVLRLHDCQLFCIFFISIDIVLCSIYTQSSDWLGKYAEGLGPIWIYHHWYWLNTNRAGATHGRPRNQRSRLLDVLVCRPRPEDARPATRCEFSARSSESCRRRCACFRKEPSPQSIWRRPRSASAWLSSRAKARALMPMASRCRCARHSSSSTRSSTQCPPSRRSL